MRVGIHQPSQTAGLIDLLIELAEHHGALGHATRSEVAAHLDTALTGSGSPITLVTAEIGAGQVAGIAALIVMPSVVETIGAQRLQCQLKELYVTEQRIAPSNARTRRCWDRSTLRSCRWST